MWLQQQSLYMIICLLRYLFAVATVLSLFCHNTYANNLPLIWSRIFVCVKTMVSQLNEIGVICFTCFSHKIFFYIYLGCTSNGFDSFLIQICECFSNIFVRIITQQSNVFTGWLVCCLLVRFRSGEAIDRDLYVVLCIHRCLLPSKFV